MTKLQTLQFDSEPESTRGKVTAPEGCCFPGARQCTATSKRTGCRCRAPAVTGWNVCRFHGAGGGQPRGPAHPNYIHGAHSIEAKAMRAMIRALLSATGELQDAIWQDF